MTPFLLAIDQGTTSTRAIVFNKQAELVSQHQIEFKQYFPELGWVEHDAEEIWQTVLQCCRHAVAKAGITFKDIVAIGITNQRETSVIWDKQTGKPLYNAIVWQDRRTGDYCRQLKQQGNEKIVQKKTGLLLDPYFSATKLHWLLNHIQGSRERAKKGELAFGTMDSYVLWRLTNGQSHATDITNASRTMLFNIHEQCWDKELLQLFDIPQELLPNVMDNCASFGFTDADFFGTAIPITGMAGDQQAALIGQACFEPGMVKSTYGTGTFMIVNTGEKALQSQHRLLTTVAYRLNNKTIYAMEGSIFSAGTIIKWLRDKLKIIASAQETEALAKQLNNNGGVYFVPAFTGLGAPYWDPEARGSIQGLTRDTQAAHIVRAGLEAVAYQTQDLLTAILADGAQLNEIRVDGGMVANNWLMQFLSDILHLPVERPRVIETTALGAALLAGLGAGIFDFDQIKKLWSCEKRFTPQMPISQREDLLQGWQTAVKKVLTDI